MHFPKTSNSSFMGLVSKGNLPQKRGLYSFSKRLWERLKIKREHKLVIKKEKLPLIGSCHHTLVLFDWI
ncbi:hypothetical protein BSM4216_1689 [Bacillus smithii]|nr:hypothetical protein BSM4216_1689 [Bacillus smithii]